jgi:hypothetical protein
MERHAKFQYFRIFTKLAKQVNIWLAFSSSMARGVSPAELMKIVGDLWGAAISTVAACQFMEEAAVLMFCRSSADRTYLPCNGFDAQDEGLRIGISSCPFFSLNHAADHRENF